MQFYLENKTQTVEKLIGKNTDSNKRGCPSYQCHNSHKHQTTLLLFLPHEFQIVAIEKYGSIMDHTQSTRELMVVLQNHQL